MSGKKRSTAKELSPASGAAEGVDLVSAFKALCDSLGVSPAEAKKRLLVSIPDDTDGAGKASRSHESGAVKIEPDGGNGGGQKLEEVSAVDADDDPGSDRTSSLHSGRLSHSESVPSAPVADTTPSRTKKVKAEVVCDNAAATGGQSSADQDAGDILLSSSKRDSDWCPTAGHWVREADRSKSWVSEGEEAARYEKLIADLCSTVKGEATYEASAEKSLAESSVSEFFVGRKIRKFFEGYGYFTGVVVKYKASKQLYQIRYEDGDREEMEQSELEDVLVDDFEADDDPLKPEQENKEPPDCEDDEQANDSISSEDDAVHEKENLDEAKKRKEEARRNRLTKLKPTGKKKRSSDSDDEDFAVSEEDEEDDDYDDDDDDDDEDFVLERRNTGPVGPSERFKIVELKIRDPAIAAIEPGVASPGDSEPIELSSEQEEDGKKKSRSKRRGGGGRRKGRDSDESEDSGKGKKKGGRGKKSDSGGGRRGRRVVEESSEEEQSTAKGKTRGGAKGGRAKTRKQRSQDSSSEESGAKRKPGRRSRVVQESESEEESEEEESEGESKGPKRKRIRKAEKLSEAQKRAAQEGLEEDRRRARRGAGAELPPEVVRCLPPSIMQHMQEHQRGGLDFMWKNVHEGDGCLARGCILAHCMGLGKTLQVVALCQAWLQLRREAVGKAPSAAASSQPPAAAAVAAVAAGGASAPKSPGLVLILAPVNTLLNWVNEFLKWLPVDEADDDADKDKEAGFYWARRGPRQVGDVTYPALFLLADAESKFKDQMELLEEWRAGGGVLLMGYEQYRNITAEKCRQAKTKADKENLRQHLVDPGPDVVICDEGHVLRNSKSALSQALSAVASRRRVVLTGTPLQNNLKEYHCMINFVRPGLLRTEKEFVRDFVSPILNGQCVDSTPADVRRMKFRISVLGKILNGVVDRRDYTVLRAYLPPKYEYVIAVRLSRLQAQLYKAYLDFVGATAPEGWDGSAGLPKPSVLVFEAFHNLARVWTHPGVLEMERGKDLRPRATAGRGGRRGGYDSMDDFVVSSDDEDDWSDEEEKRRKRRRQQLKREKEKKAKAAAAAAAVPAIADAGEEDLDGVVGDIDAVRPGEPKWWGSVLSKVSTSPKALASSCIEPYEEGTSGKLLFLFEVIDRSKKDGDKVLVFTQSLLMLELIERALEGLGKGAWKLGSTYFRLDGATDKETRESWIERFNTRPQARLFLISTRAGGLGVNLVAANRVVIMDASWNPAHDHQAVFRAYRFGQTKPVYIYRLVAHGTMEEKVYNRQITKQDLASRVVDKDKDEQFGRHFTDEELRRLFDFDSTARVAEDFALGSAGGEADGAAQAEGDRGADAGANGKKTFSYIGLPSKEDAVLTHILRRFKPSWIVGYHPTDSLIDPEDARLTDEEERAAWEEYEALEANEAAAREADRAVREAERVRQRLAGQAGQAAGQQRPPAGGRLRVLNPGTAEQFIAGLPPHMQTYLNEIYKRTQDWGQVISSYARMNGQSEDVSLSAGLAQGAAQAFMRNNSEGLRQGAVNRQQPSQIPSYQQPQYLLQMPQQMQYMSQMQQMQPHMQHMHMLQHMQNPPNAYGMPNLQGHPGYNPGYNFGMVPVPIPRNVIAGDGGARQAPQPIGASHLPSRPPSTGGGAAVRNPPGHASGSTAVAEGAGAQPPAATQRPSAPPPSSQPVAAKAGAGGGRPPQAAGAAGKGGPAASSAPNAHDQDRARRSRAAGSAGGSRGVANGVGIDVVDLTAGDQPSNR